MVKLIWGTEKRKVKNLKSWDKNPRQITEYQFEQLKQSIDRFNYVELVAVDTDDTIVAGHMRIRALLDLNRGDEDIEVRIPNRKLTEKEFKEYNIRSNKNTGTWDWDLLANEFEIPDLLEWGFQPIELGIETGDNSGSGDGDGSGGGEPGPEALEALKTVGALKKRIEGIPDDTELYLTDLKGKKRFFYLEMETDEMDAKKALVSLKFTKN